MVGFLGMVLGCPVAKLPAVVCVSAMPLLAEVVAITFFAITLSFSKGPYSLPTTFLLEVASSGSKSESLLPKFFFFLARVALGGKP